MILHVKQDTVKVSDSLECEETTSNESYNAVQVSDSMECEEVNSNDPTHKLNSVITSSIQVLPKQDKDSIDDWMTTTTNTNANNKVLLCLCLSWISPRQYCLARAFNFNASIDHMSDRSKERLEDLIMRYF